MGYNLTSTDNATSLGDFFVNVNSLANGLPGVVILIVLWVATFVYATNRNLDPGESFTTSSFISLIISGLLYFAGMMSLPVVILLVVMFFGGVIYLMFK